VTAVPTVPIAGRPALVRHVRMRYDPKRERHVLLAPESVIVLNPTGADILELCDGRRTVTDIVGELARRYDRVVDDEVQTFLSQLARRHLVDIREDAIREEGTDG
jgi:pyrroloquinoline quinone biosynthesis protein D